MALKQSYKGQYKRPEPVSKVHQRPSKGKPISPQRAQIIKGMTVAQPKGGQPRKGTVYGMDRNQPLKAPKGGRR